tara:strand:- start:1268 stop:2155 length:888 start_codon:yes stop_codon:yes gene_type:complete
MKLAIGTAQFGMNYGISNKTGKIANSELEEIFKIMKKNKINLIDTAKNYGNAEKIIGKYANLTSDFKIITKFDISNLSNFSAHYIDKLNNLFEESLINLNRNKIEGVLIHNPYVLSKNSAKIIFEWFYKLKSKGLIKKIGLSIYEKNDLLNYDLDKVDLVQLPLSIYDQRLLNDGTIDLLRNKGISIQIRSIFLQGLILENTNNWPSFFSKKFIKHHNNFNLFLLENNLEAIEATFIFLKSLNKVNSVVIGITNKEELTSLSNIWFKVLKSSSSFSEIKNWNWDESKFLDPRNWP